jgi:hypothetical protein
VGMGDESRFYNFFGREGLSGGLNVTDNPLIVPPQQMVEAKNISISQTLSRKKRPGQVRYHLGSFAGTASYPDSGVPIRGILQYHRFASSSGDTLQDLFLHQGSKVWSIEDRLSVAIERQGAATLSSDGIPRYQVFEGILFFVTSEVTDGYYKWNGLAQPAGDIEAATPPADGAGTLLGTWFGRMIMAGNPDFPFRVYISGPYEPELWDTVDGGTSFDLTYDGEPGGIKAIFPEKDGRLFVATSRSIYELTASDPNDVATFQLRRVTRGVGCVGQGSVVATPNDILFMSQRGLHSIRKIIVSDQSEISFLSRDVQSIFTNVLNPLLLEQISAQWDEKDNLYIATVPSDGQSTNDLVLAYNINFDLWLIWEDIDARSTGQLIEDGRSFVLLGKEDGDITYLDPDQTADLDSGFSCTFKTGKFFPDGDITHEKEFVSVTLLVSAQQVSDVTIAWNIDSLDTSKNGSVTVEVGAGADLLGTSFVLGQSALGSGRFLPVRVSVGDIGYNFQLQVTASGDSGLEFHGWVLEVKDANTNYA